uniref:SH2 domain-containing adapter protein D n=1 Tax=Clastoptera arizonana TaxID=38151 RepID=A0A1B6CFD2_9HEMI
MPPLRSKGDTDADVDEMSRQRNFYETAFDSRVSRSDDDLDVDVVINKCILPSAKPPRPGPSGEERRRSNLSRQEMVKKKPRGLKMRKDTVDSMTQDMSNLDIQNSPLPLRGFAPTPPSSAPLPTKFPSSHSMASVHSAPNLPGTRIKDSRLPVKSLKCRLEDSRALEGRPNDRPELRFGRPKSLFCPTDISEIKGRPEVLANQVLEIKGRPKRVHVKYSSTESMATSSSGGSLESIRSSTSEGNRSTSSSESHRSSSLSSHSSDSSSSGFPVVGTPMGARFFQQTKLHILSPISDKSSQEPGSETSENNKNNNSHGASPEENTLVSPVPEQTQETTVQLQKPKRRTPQNKNLINLGFTQSGDSETHQGSDSGISIESRCGGNGLHNQNNVDLSDLPFDMPKLRRRRMLQQSINVQDTSGSATSVDLKDLPFDMPKLRRRMRIAPPSTESSGVSQASSSHSVQEVDVRPVSMPIMSRPSLTLDLEPGPKQMRSFGLSLDLTETSAAIAGEDIEVDLPLERQGWYHGVITRLEAEKVLRNTEEGSYLVRNSESSRLDYSLSLKSARGFMHMRIQQCRETGKYILGQFSNPFNTIPQMIQHYSINRLPIRGAEHMCLLHPVIEQLL